MTATTSPWIDTSVPTTYIITYAAVDSAGNNTTVHRAVIIGSDGTLDTTQMLTDSVGSMSSPIVITPLATSTTATDSTPAAIETVPAATTDVSGTSTAPAPTTGEAPANTGSTDTTTTPAETTASPADALPAPAP